MPLKAEIIAYKTREFSGEIGRMTLPLVHDTDIKQTFEIDWTGGAAQNGGTAQGESAPITNFKTYKFTDSNLTLKVMIDATGVYESNVAGINCKSPDITEYVKNLRKFLYCYVAETHQPPFLKLVWGKIFASETTEESGGISGAFKCVLGKLEIDYKLFSDTGKPVRAIATIELQPFIDPTTRPAGNSPDLSHVITIKHGDNLPKLCQDVYDDTRYYHQVAQINNLPSAYALKPGMQLLFPPLDKVAR